MDPAKINIAPLTAEEEAEVRTDVKRLANEFPDVAEQAELASYVPRLLETIDALREEKEGAVSGWTNMRVIAAGMRRNANYALDQWEGEERALEEIEQEEVKKLLQEISGTTWPIPWAEPAPKS